MRYIWEMADESAQSIDGDELSDEVFGGMDDEDAAATFDPASHPLALSAVAPCLADLPE